MQDMPVLCSLNRFIDFLHQKISVPEVLIYAILCQGVVNCKNSKIHETY